MQGQSTMQEVKLNVIHNSAMSGVLQKQGNATDIQ